MQQGRTSCPLEERSVAEKGTAGEQSLCSHCHTHILTRASLAMLPAIMHSCWADFDSSKIK